jgi:hypothetical protein
MKSQERLLTLSGCEFIHSCGEDADGVDLLVLLLLSPPP